MEAGPSTVENIICVCVVCDLLKKGFSTYSFQDKLDIIRNGRPTPDLKHLKTKVKSCNRYFNIEMYSSNQWLTGCENLCKLFCWPCVLFTNEKGVWNKNGFSDLNNLHKVTKRHGKCEKRL